MATYRQTVKQCGVLIEKSELKTLLMPLWRPIEWQGHTENISAGAEFDRKGRSTIHLYPSLEKSNDATQKVLREFGNLVMARSGERGEALWRNKLDVPTKEQIDTAKHKLADPELRVTCKTYKDVLDSYPDKGGSVTKLVFINIMNALLANNIAYRDSVGVDITTWGPTYEYTNLKKYHCLIPLVSAYSPADIYNCFGYAMASMIADGLTSVADSSVAFALRGLIQRIVRISSPE